MQGSNPSNRIGSTYNSIGSIMNISEVAAFCAHDSRGRLRVSGETYQRIYRPCTARLIEFFEDVPVTDLTADDLKDWQEWLDSRDTAVATRNTYVRTARALWNHLRSRGVPVCDASTIFKFRKEQKGVKSVSSANAWRMLAATGIRDTSLLWLAMDSARRRGGLADLQLDNFRIIYNEELEEFYVVGRVVEKGEKEQILLAYHGAAMALSAWLIVREELLRALRVPDHGYVFVDTKTGQPLSKQTMSAITSKIAQRAGIPAHEPTNLHSFRHRRAKEMLKDLSITEVRDILGHSSIKTTADCYAVNGAEELISAFFNRAKRK
jgi:site-specific recombinase XerD